MQFNVNFMQLNVDLMDVDSMQLNVALKQFNID